MLSRAVQNFKNGKKMLIVHENMQNIQCGNNFWEKMNIIKDHINKRE